MRLQERLDSEGGASYHCRVGAIRRRYERGSVGQGVMPRDWHRVGRLTKRVPSDRPAERRTGAGGGCHGGGWWKENQSVLTKVLY